MLEQARLLLLLEAEQGQISCMATVTLAPQEQQVQPLKEQFDKLTA